MFYKIKNGYIISKTDEIATVLSKNCMTFENADRVGLIDYYFQQKGIKQSQEIYDLYKNKYFILSDSNKMKLATYGLDCEIIDIVDCPILSPDWFSENEESIQDILYEELKRSKITELKTEGSRRIQTINGKCYDHIAWLRKSQNYQDAIARYFPLSLYQRLPDEQFNLLQEAISVISRKDRYVVRINEVEDRINKADSLDELNAIDVQSQQNWEGLD